MPEPLRRMPLWLVAPALLAVAFFIMVLGPGRTEGQAAEKPMTDDWKLRYFGNLAVAEEDDPDRDTLSNVFEAEIGTDPTAEDSDKDGNPDWMGIASYLFQEKWQEPDGWPLHAADRRHEFNRPGGMQFFNHGAKADSTGGNAFHQRLRGKLTAPVSGDYEFWIAGDNGCELWLGVDGSRFGARRLAGLPHGNSRTQPDEWEKYPGQKSAKVTLEAGRGYYLEILHRDFRGFDHVSLAWKPPGGVLEPVPAAALRSLVVDPEDRDDDGMRDAWEIANGLVVGTHDAMEDTDGDGIVNVLEHEAGGDPQDPAALDGLLSWSRWDWPGTPADPEKFIAAGGLGRDPVHRDALAGFKLPRGTGTGTIDRLHGTLTAPEDGIYSFWLTGKVPAILSLSTDSHAFNKRTIARNAHLRSATNIVWQGNTHSVRSIPVRLKKGERYAIEALLPSITSYPPFGVSWKRHAAAAWIDGSLADGVSGTWAEPDGATVARVTGSGGFGGTFGDAMAFRHAEVEDAVEAVGRMDSLTSLPKGSGGGLMLRESADPFAPFVAVTFDARRKIVFHSRVKSGEPVKSAESTRSLAGTLRLKESLWLRLRADGKECHALWSVDGVTWHDAGKVALKFGERTMAGPVAWGAASKEPVEVRFSDLVVDGLFGSEPVPAKVLATTGPDPEDMDADGLPDAWERANGIDPAIGKGPDGAGGDPDGDRLSHAREFKLGGDPRKAGGIPGSLSRELWGDIPGSRVSDLVDHIKFRGKADISDLIPRPDLEGGVDSNYGQRIRGTIVAPADGTYRFWIAGDNGCTLALSKSEDPLDKRVIASLAGVDGASAKMHEWDKFPSQVSAPVELTGGREYFIEILHKEGRGSDHIAVAWEYRTPAGQVRAREILPSSALRSYVPDTRDRDEDDLPDEWEVRMCLDPQDNGYHDNRREGSAGDHDGDRLTNREEYLLGTHPCLADSDRDGVDDHDEVRLYGSNPLLKDAVPPVLHADLPLGGVIAVPGQWQVTSDGVLTSTALRGSASFGFEVESPGLYVVKLVARSVSSGDYAPPVPVTALLDGKEVGRGFVSQRSASLSLISHWLLPGSHTVTINNDNLRFAAGLEITSLELLRIVGDDGNRDGLPDWLAASLASSNGIALPDTEVVHSEVSPAFVEGKSRLPGGAMLRANGVAVEVKPGVDQGWYADVPLAAEGETVVEAGFEGGAIAIRKRLVWTAVDPFRVADRLEVRVGDSMKFLVNDHAESGWSLVIDGKAMANESASREVVVRFERAGDHVIEVTSGAGEVARRFVVGAIGADFGPEFSLAAGAPRVWNLPGVPASLVLDHDPRFVLTTEENASGAGRKLTALWTGKRAARPVVLARLGEGGPVVASTRLNIFKLVDAAESGDAHVVEVLPDGTRVVEISYIIEGEIPADFSLWIDLYVTDAVFADGSTRYHLTANDFDENGIARIKIYKVAGSGPAFVCHWNRLFEEESE